MSNGQFTDLAILAGLIERPLRVEEAAEALDISPQDVLARAHEGVEQGVLASEGSGYVLTGAAPEVDPPYLAYLAGKLAETLTARGANGEAGKLFIRAGREVEAIGALVAAALGDDDEQAANLALELDPELTPVERQDAGRLHLMLARHARDHGSSPTADEHARNAIRRLEGPELIDALRFGAAVASDLQDSQRAESLTALGAGVAISLGRKDKAGTMLTLLGRELNRLGFADEADAALARGIAMLDTHGDRSEQFLGRMNAGWVAFDRGILQEAEITFDNLTDQADDLHDSVTKSSQMAYHSRALGMVGRINESRVRAAQARAIAAEYGARAIEFLVALGEVEGALAFRRPADAAEAVENADRIAREHLPSWLNRTLHYEAKAALLVGDRETARRALAEAREHTPSGIDGWRVRNLIRITEMEMIEGDWPQGEAEDLTDEFLQSRQYLAAAELLTIRAEREKDAELALQAAALAGQVGAPAHAALAIEAAGAWDDAPVAAAAGEMIRRAAAAMPDDWRDGLRDVPAFAHALDAEPLETPDSEALDDLLAEVLTSAGLTGDFVLSPAQRRARGLVRRKSRRRKTSPVTWLAAAVGGAALVVSIFAVTAGDGPATGTTLAAQPTTTTSSTTTTTLPEDPNPEPPELGLFGESQFRGSDGLTGVASEPALTAFNGHYWAQKPGGFFRADPVAAGRFLYLGSSTNDQVYLIDLTTGIVADRLEADGRVLVPVAVGDMNVARGDGTVKMVVYVAEGGTVHGRPVEGGGAFAPLSLGSDVSAGPVIAGGLAVIPTEGGRVYALNSDGIEWIYPAEDQEPLAEIGEEAAYADGILYVVDQSGELHLIEAETGTGICSRRFGQPPVGNPVVSDGNVYVQATGVVVIAPAGTCEGTESVVVASPEVTNPIAVQDGIIFSAEANRLFPFDPNLMTLESMGSDSQLGPWAPFIADSDITTPPVIAGELVIFGTQNGIVYAVDLATGEEVWRFDVGVATGESVGIEGSPVVLKNTVIVMTNQGNLVAIASGE
ncbi:MAG TPA: PQQ-binding-like beta-propeller repeat protein [Acidimicrobiia bacterium]|nr:PQQ-binding-like beta-propeller repeat protein [Acidimicrobiia bacterium]